MLTRIKLIIALKLLKSIGDVDKNKHQQFWRAIKFSSNEIVALTKEGK